MTSTNCDRCGFVMSSANLNRLIGTDPNTVNAVRFLTGVSMTGREIGPYDLCNDCYKIIGETICTAMKEKRL